VALRDRLPPRPVGVELGGFGADPLDVDADFALAGNCDQGQFAGMAEVEAKRRTGGSEHRLAALAETQLDLHWLTFEVAAEHLAQRPACGHPTLAGGITEQLGGAITLCRGQPIWRRPPVSVEPCLPHVQLGDRHSAWSLHCRRP
jgi:hypothetical protein